MVNKYKETEKNKTLGETAGETEVLKSGQSRAFTSFFEWIEALITAVVVVVIVFTFVCRVVSVSGPSMENTIHDGDKVLITDWAYKPQNGDIVVVTHAANFAEPLIKRVIATEGQSLNINFNTGDVVVDGKLLDEKYIKNETINSEGGVIPSVIPHGYVFVMGDNRQNSKDSRSPQIGLIDNRTILGKAQYVIFPFDRIGGLD